MGYIGTPCSSALQQLFIDGHAQVCKITVTPLDGTPFVLTETRVKGLTVDRYSVTGDELQLGTCVASEINLTLDNTDYALNQYKFAGARLDVEIGVADWDLENPTPQYINIGRYVVDEAPRMLQTISLVGLDNMALLDRYVVLEDLQDQYTLTALINAICQKCGLVIDSSSFTRGIPNLDVTVHIPKDDDNLTYRQLMIWACQCCGAIGYIDYLGRFALDVYQSDNTSTVQPIVTLSTAVRYTSDVAENTIVITGIETVVNDVDTPYHDENYQDGYVISFENKLVDALNAQLLVNGIGTVYNGFTYTPYSASVKSMPWLIPLSAINYVAKQYVDGNGNLVTESGDNIVAENTDNIVTEGRAIEEQDITLRSIVTNVTFVMNGGTQLAGKGKTIENKGYASTGYLTPQQQTIVDNLKDNLDRDTIDKVYSAKLAINEAMYNSMGFYSTTVTTESGGTILYCHNKPNLADSNIVYRVTELGTAWTTQYNGDQTVWQYGVDVQGNAVFSTIETNTLSANYVRTGKLDSTKKDLVGRPISSIDLDNGTFDFGTSFDIIGTSFRVPSLKLDEYGKLVLYGYLYSTADQNHNFRFGFKENILGSNMGIQMGYGADTIGALPTPTLQMYTEGTYNSLGATVLVAPHTRESGSTIGSEIRLAKEYIRLQKEYSSEKYTQIYQYSSEDGTDTHITLASHNVNNTFLTNIARLRLSTPNSNAQFFELYSKFGTGTACTIQSHHGASTYIETLCGDNSFTVGSASSSFNKDVYVYATMYANNYDVTSDRELKKNIIEIKPNALKEISNLKFYEYDFKDNDTHQKLGIMANDSPYEITGKDNKSINQYAFTSYVARAVQELNEKVETLEQELKELRGDNKK